MEKLFCVKPGANPGQIKIRLSGAETSLEKGARGLSVNEQGELVAETALGPVKFMKAEAYTDGNGQATFTITAANKKGNAVVRFKHKNLTGDVTVKVRKP